MIMSKHKDAVSMESVLECVERSVAGPNARAAKAMFYFLYKEILVNRMLVLEADPHGNKAGIEHSEKLINELNQKLMKEMEAAKA